MKKYHRTTSRLVVRPLKLSDFESWRDAYSSMRPQQNQFDASLNRPTKSTGF
ncbi:MAG: hypothetical protein ACK5V3_07100 [Bdellovibrionales bacterium]